MLIRGHLRFDDSSSSDEDHGSTGLTAAAREFSLDFESRAGSEQNVENMSWSVFESTDYVAAHIRKRLMDLMVAARRWHPGLNLTTVLRNNDLIVHSS